MFPRNASWHQRAARALIAQSDSQVTTFLYLPSFTPRKASAAAAWSEKRKMFRKRALAAASDALRGVKETGDRGRYSADSSQQFWRRSIHHRPQTPAELSRWCTLRRRTSQIIITRGSQRHLGLASSAPIGRRPSSCQPIRDEESLLFASRISMYFRSHLQ